MEIQKCNLRTVYYEGVEVEVDEKELEQWSEREKKKSEGGEGGDATNLYVFGTERRKGNQRKYRWSKRVIIVSCCAFCSSRKRVRFEAI